MNLKLIQLSEFQKDIKRLSKKFRSLPTDLLMVEKALLTTPILHNTQFIEGLGNTIKIMVLKVRVISKSIRGGRGRSPLRLIYAYDEPNFTMIFVELYLDAPKPKGLGFLQHA